MYNEQVCEHTALFSLLSDGYFEIPSKYLKSKIGAAGRPGEKDGGKASRIGWNVWCCGDEMSKLDSGVVSSRMDEVMSLDKRSSTYQGKESSMPNFGKEGSATLKSESGLLELLGGGDVCEGRPT